MDILEFCRKEGVVLSVEYRGGKGFEACLAHMVTRATAGGGAVQCNIGVDGKQSYGVVAEDVSPTVAIQKLTEKLSEKELYIKQVDCDNKILREWRTMIPQLTYLQTA